MSCICSRERMVSQFETAWLFFCFPEYSTSSYLVSLLISYLPVIPIIYLQSFQCHSLNPNFPFNSNICFLWAVKISVQKHISRIRYLQSMAIQSQCDTVLVFSGSSLVGFGEGGEVKTERVGERSTFRQRGRQGSRWVIMWNGFHPPQSTELIILWYPIWE